MPSIEKQKVCVLGAGVIGVTTAWLLRKKGFDVSVVESEVSVAMGTSFANGAQISVSNAMPWAAPDTPLRILQSFIGKNRGIFISPRLSFKQWAWGMQFLWNCRSSVAQNNLEKMVAICVRSRELYNELLKQRPIDFDCLGNGILHLYFDIKEYESAKRVQSKWGKCLAGHREDLGVSEMLSIEPALEPIKDKIVGGFYAAEDMTGNAYKFSVALAEMCAQEGVQFHYETRALSLKPEKKKVVVVTDKDEFCVDHAVCCLGVHSEDLLKPLDISTAIYPVKGYSITTKLGDADKDVPMVSILDESSKIVMTRLGEYLRVAGIAEVSDYNTDINPHRIELLTQWMGTFFPHIPLRDVSVWMGLRPLSPSNLPYVGASKHPRVWLNCGHGTLGWTAAMGTAEQLACDILTF